MYVLILGQPDDIRCQRLADQINQTPYQAVIFDTCTIAGSASLSWYPHRHDGELCIDNKVILLSQIVAGYWLSYTPVISADSGLSNVAREQLISAEYTGLLYILFRFPGIRWINPADAIILHQCKGIQLYSAQQAGLTIPTTLITNHSAAASAFMHTDSAIIAKPVQGGAYTRLLSSTMKHEHYLQSRLSRCPATFQQFITGTNIRSYIVGEQIVSAELRSDAVDFRLDEATHMLPHTLPAALCKKSLLLARQLSLVWAAIDWRLTPEGRYIFLEINPAPHFSRFEDEVGLSISTLLAGLLPANTCPSSKLTSHAEPFMS